MLPICYSFYTKIHVREMSFRDNDKCKASNKPYISYKCLYFPSKKFLLKILKDL